MYLDRVYCDVLRKVLPDPDLHAEFHEELELVERLRSACTENGIFQN